MRRVHRHRHQPPVQLQLQQQQHYQFIRILIRREVATTLEPRVRQQLNRMIRIKSKESLPHQHNERGSSFYKLSSSTR